VWYVRLDRGPRIRIKAAFGTAEFDSEYQAALNGTPIRKAAPSLNSLTWLLTRYRETAAWTALSAATRRQRENIFKQLIETAGHQSFARIATSDIEAGKERRAHTPAQARNFLDAMRGLFRWAKSAGLVKYDPTAGVRNPPRKRSDGFIPWTEEHAAAYREHWAIGTRQRVWLEVLLHTGLRRGDAVMLGRQHARAGFIKTEKSGFALEVPVIIRPELQEILDAGPCGDLAYICGEGGEPLIKESFGNMFRDACKAAGVPGSAHGVRKLAATVMALAGVTDRELMAVFGWTDPKMAALYTRSANKRRLAARAHDKLNVSGTSIPAPSHLVRAKG
jgi:integrase